MCCYVEHIDEEFLREQGTQPRRDGQRPDGTQVEKLVHLALPVRLIHMPNGERGGLELACTYDIHPRGARLRSSRDLQVGDLSPWSAAG
jgi:hypothetical protein